MSAVDSPATTNTTTTTTTTTRNHHRNHHHHHHHHHNHQQSFDHRCVLPTKRKLEDYDSEFIGGGDDDSSSSAVSAAVTRQRKSSNSNSKGKTVVEAESDQSSQLFRGESSQSSGGIVNSPRLQLQFFVKMISGGKTLVLQANLEDTVELVLRKIQEITGIPLIEQRLIYGGKQLQWEQTLEACGVQNDAGLQLVGRMRSTDHPRAWRVISDMVNLICKVCRNEMPNSECRIVKEKLEKYMALPSDNRENELTKNYENDRENNDDNDDKAEGEGEERISKTDRYKIFMDACAPQALVMMYMSPDQKNQECANYCIKYVVSFAKDAGGNTWIDMAYCATTVLEFCKLLRMSRTGDKSLYKHCRSALGMMLEKVKVLEGVASQRGITFITVGDVFPILMEVGESLVRDLMPTVGCERIVQEICDFSAFLQPVLRCIGKELKEAAASCGDKGKGKVSFLGDEVGRLLHLFNDLLSRIDTCLVQMDLRLAMKRKKDVEVHQSGSSHYLAVLKELSSMAVLYPGSEDRFRTVMRKNEVVVRALVVRYATRLDDHSWLVKQKDVLDFESRRHLAMLMFPEVREDYEELHEMLIDRSKLLAESFEYIISAEPSSLHAGLFMEFKNEEATGPGVLREWFCLVCQALFDPQNALFVCCPLDRRRFYPSPASKVHPLHLRYFRFAGRVIALALMHKIQIGVVLDRVFFLQLAKKPVLVNDIKDADPCLYNSCKQILEMDPEFVDSDGLGLTFVTEVEELGSRKVVELCSGGNVKVVNSRNRKDYVHLIVQHRFVTSIKDQVLSFGQGFTDIIRDNIIETSFFESLELEDLDWMLHGSGSEEISVEDWREHTDYHGYKKSDPQMTWFWEVVKELNAQQKKTLLFFWTSVKYLPVEGFRGLASRLFIYKSFDSQDLLPSSHTCFYRLCIPPYSTKAIMKDRIGLITQEHVGCSFGTW